MKTLTEWQAAAADLEVRTRAFIDGSWADAADGSTFSCINPATGASIAQVTAGDVEDVNRAVAAATAEATVTAKATAAAIVAVAISILRIKLVGIHKAGV